jgi:hypothetical protein
MKKLALILALALATTPAFARAGESAAIGVEFTPGAASVFMAIVTSIEVAAMATVTTDIMATTDIMVITVVIPEPPLA